MAGGPPWVWFRQVEGGGARWGVLWFRGVPLSLGFSPARHGGMLGLVVLSVVGFLGLQGRYRTALVVLITAASGEVISIALKNVFLRPRPTVVPHLRDVASTSFPSGHAMESAIIYLTLGAMLMRLAERRITKLYVMGMAIFLTFLVGVSRVYLGVHYPTDVIGGLMFCVLWASLCWLVAQPLDAQTGADQESQKA